MCHPSAAPRAFTLHPFQHTQEGGQVAFFTWSQDIFAYATGCNERQRRVDVD
jgi:hypothetical protein